MVLDEAVLAAVGRAALGEVLVQVYRDGVFGCAAEVGSKVVYATLCGVQGSCKIGENGVNFRCYHSIIGHTSRVGRTTFEVG